MREALEGSKAEIDRPLSGEAQLSFCVYRWSSQQLSVELPARYCSRARQATTFGKEVRIVDRRIYRLVCRRVVVGIEVVGQNTSTAAKRTLDALSHN